MKYWVLKDNSDDTKLVIVGSSQTPPGAICKAPEGLTTADGDLVDLEDVLDEITQEVIGKKALVNQARKDQKELDETAAKNVADDKKNEMASMRTKLLDHANGTLSPAISDGEALKDLIKCVLGN